MARIIHEGRRSLVLAGDAYNPGGQLVASGHCQFHPATADGPLTARAAVLLGSGPVPPRAIRPGIGQDPKEAHGQARYAALIATALVP